VSNPWRIARGVIWGSLAVVVLSGWFVVTRVGLRQDLRVWDVKALRFGEGALFLTPVLLVGPLRLRVQAWPSGIILALLWGAPFILLVGLGLQATSATMTSTVTPALMPVFAGFVAWTFFGERPSRRQLSGYGMIAAGLFALICVYVQAAGRLDMGGAAALVTAAVLWAVYTLRLPRAGVTSLQAAALNCFWSAILYLPLYLGFSLSGLTHASEGELVFQSIYQGIMMSVVALFAFNRAVVLLGPRAAAVIIALVPVTATPWRYRFSANCHHGRRQPPSASLRWGSAWLSARPTKATKREKANDPLLFPPDAQPRESRADARRDRLGLSGGSG
jgi:drug/metabolite transporter (DMT)-like permease